MAEIKDVIAFFCENYPYKDELSKARLTKMVYLADWKSCIDRGKPITEISWKFNHYGPYVEDVVDAARKTQDFEVRSDVNAYGDLKETIVLKRAAKKTSLSKEEVSVLNHVIQQTEKLNWNSFIKLVYSTFPVLVSERHSIMDLQKLARRYKREVTSTAAA